MSGKAVGIEITYKCVECKERFTTWLDVSPTEFQLTLGLEEEHEDCPKAEGDA